MERKLTKGEDTLPIVSVGGAFFTAAQSDSYSMSRGEISDSLLIARMELRVAQGRVKALQNLSLGDTSISPADQIKFMQNPDSAIGQQLLSAERTLAIHQMAILGVQYGRA